MPEPAEVQKQLQQQRDGYEAALACVADAVLIVDAKGRVAHLNAAAERLTGWTLAQARDTPIEQVAQLVEGDGGAELVTRQGTRIAVEAQTVPTRDAQGANSGAVLVLRDVSSRRRAELALRQGEQLVRAGFNQAPIGIAVVGRDDRFIDVNQHLCTTLGYSHAELCTLTFLDITHPDDRSPTSTQVARLVQGEIPHYALEKRYLRKDGATIWVKVTVTLLRDARGAVDRFIGVIDDVTQRRRTEAELRDARARLEVTLNSAEIGTWTWDVRADRVVADRNLARLFGSMGPQAQAGRVEDYLAALHPDDLSRVQDAIAASLSSADGRYEVDFRVRQPDGSVRWVAARGQALRDAQGVTQMPGVIIDITGRKQAEDALRDALQRLQLLLAASNLGDWQWDAATDEMKLSPRAAEIYGIAVDETVYRSTLRVQLLPEDGERARVVAEQAMRTHSDYVIEYQIRQRSGERRWVAVRGRWLEDPDGTVRGMIGVVQDITDRRDAEASRARLAAVVESSDDAIVSKTLDGIITTWNLGAQRTFGYSAEEATGKHITMLIPEEFLDEETSIIERLKRGERIDHFETLRMRKDGSLLNVSLTVSPIKDVNGVVVGASKIARDITQQKQLYAALQDTDRRKDEFLATLAHELRNPLAPIRQAALISKDPAATELQKRWSHDVISRQVQNMALLLDDLLDISRITRGTLELRKEPTDLIAIVEAAVETARPAIDARHHEFAIELPDAPVRFVADPLRLAQVLSNLLVNAAKYTDPRGRIRLRATCVGEQLQLSVRDSGVGIAPEALNSVFAMFAQVTSSRDRSEGGLGIGLALSRGLIELHDGHIEARSAGLGRGSEFVVLLPLVPVPAPLAVTHNAQSATAVSRRVLIADDNRDAADSLAMLLTMEGHEVAVVHDGRAALEHLLKNPPEVALLDVGMPGLTGYEIARQLHDVKPDNRVTLVAVTGWGQETDKADARAAGFDHHFTKPVDPAILSRLLREERAPS